MGAETASSTIAPLEVRVDYKECFTLFTKPELFLGGAENVDAVLREIFARLREVEVCLGGIVVIAPKDVQERELIAKCYERLANVSVDGLSECAAAQRQAIEREAGNRGVRLENIIGGEQFLCQFPDYTAEALGSMVDEQGCKKFGAGVYASFITVADKELMVLNGFYPAQESWLSRGRVPLVALCCYSNFSPREIRERLIGSIIPSEASPGTLRRTFFEKRKEYGLDRVDIARNCIHFSANPVDAAFYQCVLFGVGLADTALGKKANQFGLSAETIRELYYAKDLEYREELADLRDMIEDMETEECLSLVLELWEENGAGR